MSPSTPPPPNPEAIPPRRHAGNPLGAAGVGGFGGGRGDSWVPPTRDSLLRARGRRRRRRPSPAPSCRGHAGRKRWGPPHPATPEPSGCVWGGIHAWGGPFPAFRRLRLSLAPHRRPLHGERRGGHGGFCETGRSRGRCQAAPRRAPTRGRGASGTDGGRPSRCSRERGWGGGDLPDVKVRGKDGAPGAASAHSLPGGA